MYEGPVQDLIDELGRLPGIGPKSAQRLAFHILAADPDDVRRLADILKVVKETVKFCERTNTLRRKIVPQPVTTASPRDAAEVGERPAVAGLPFPRSGR